MTVTTVFTELDDWLRDSLTPADQDVLRRQTSVREGNGLEDEVRRTAVTRIMEAAPPLRHAVVLWGGGDVPLDTFVFDCAISHARRRSPVFHADRERVSSSHTWDVPWIMSVRVPSGGHVLRLDDGALLLPFSVRFRVDRIVPAMHDDPLMHVLCTCDVY